MEKRTFELSLEKAKEWFKEGGELKKIALEVYTKKELEDFKYTWENCFEVGTGVYAVSDGNVSLEVGNSRDSSHTACVTRKQALSTIAFAKLTFVIDRLNKDFPSSAKDDGCSFFPYWNKCTEYFVTHFQNRSMVSIIGVRTQKACEILIRDNEELLKQYYMID